MPDERLYVTGRDEWRAWLLGHHDVTKVVWLVFYRKETGEPSLLYEDAVEEALCYGWIDSIIKKIDDASYARKFTPRTETAVWSEDNKRRVAKLVREGRMADAGQRVIEAAKRNGSWDRGYAAPPAAEMPAEFEAALAANETARCNFEKLAPSHRKQYLRWVAGAKQSGTRVRRAAEAVGRLERNEPLGLK